MNRTILIIVCLNFSSLGFKMTKYSGVEGGEAPGLFICKDVLGLGFLDCRMVKEK